MVARSSLGSPLLFEGMRISLLVTLATLVVARDSVAAQSVSVMAQAIPLVTTADPTATRTTVTEGYVTQPAVMAHAAWGVLRGVSTINLEGLTLRRGELNTGAWGEGYVDRRHPHTYLHELLAGVEADRGKWDASLFAGRGFVPFGSDDPMVRPFEKYPLNHHLSQILERVVAVGAVRYGPVIGEFGTFNGDEPTGPGAPPNYSRFGDSWASRLTLLPLPNVELSASAASVTSPELRTGGGLDQRKRSVVARYEARSPEWWRYALVEWAHTDEHQQAVTPTRLSTWLGEGALCRSGVIVAGRIERTDRPEEERLADPFRTPVPASDLSNLGVSRWTVLSASLAAPRVSARWASARPFGEVEYLRPMRGNPPGVFDPELRYGATRLWMFSFGVRLRAGMGGMHDRMGRYGAAVPRASGMAMPGMPSMSGDMPMDHSMAMGRPPASDGCGL